MPATQSPPLPQPPPIILVLADPEVGVIHPEAVAEVGDHADPAVGVTHPEVAVEAGDHAGLGPPNPPDNLPQAGAGPLEAGAVAKLAQWTHLPQAGVPLTLRLILQT